MNLENFRPALSAVKRSFLLSLLLTFSVFSLSACGDSNFSNPKHGDYEQNAPDTQKSRYDSLPPLGLEPGEAKPGIHLRPGIEIIKLDEQQSQNVRIDVENMTAEVSGLAKDKMDEQEEIWSGDIFMGDGFIYRIEDIQEVDGKYIVQLAPFELLDVIHGEWDIALGPEDAQEGVRQQGLLPKIDLKKALSVSLSSEVELRGDISFPSSWEGAFRGKISLGGKGINVNYTCDAVEVKRLLGKGTYEKVPERFCIDYILVKGSAGIQLEYGYTITTTGKASFNPEKTWDDFPAGRALLGTTGLAIYFEPFFKAGLDISIQGEVSHTFDTSAGLTLPMGFEYRPSQDGFSLLPNARHPISRNATITTSADAKASASAKLYGQLGVKIALSDALSSKGLRLTGPSIHAELAAEAKLTPIQFTTNGNHDPCLTAEVYAQATAEAVLEAELDIAADWKWTKKISAAVSTKSPKWHLRDPWKSKGDDFCLAVNKPGELIVNLRWEADTDLDLYMVTPTGAGMYYGNRSSGDGGIYLGDSCIDESCEGPQEETILWEHKSPPPGQYQVWAVNDDGRAPADYSIEVINEHGSVVTFQGTLGAIEGQESEIHTFYVGREP